VGAGSVTGALTINAAAFTERALVVSDWQENPAMTKNNKHSERGSLLCNVVV
jgi:hypothetical protein